MASFTAQRLPFYTHSVARIHFKMIIQRYQGKSVEREIEKKKTKIHKEWQIHAMLECAHTTDTTMLQIRQIIQVIQVIQCDVDWLEEWTKK